MLTDIFAYRYQKTRLWDQFTEEPRRLLTQGLQLLGDICPYYINGEEYQFGKEFWTRMHDLLARELGLKELSPRAWGYWLDSNGRKIWQSGSYTYYAMCENWMLAKFDGNLSADRFIKERLSLVEIGFRNREAFIADANAKLAENIAAAMQFDATRSQLKGLVLPGSRVEGVKAANATLNKNFQAAVTELNARFRQSECSLHYHNGFIQISKDEAVAAEVETPFWKLVADAKWANVDHDMKEAIDLRDTGGRDPAFYAVRSLESTIKILSDEKRLTSGREKGAHNYIDNLMGAKLIEVWEMEALKHLFTKVRNPFGHGPGAAPMPSLTDHQTNWAIENSMVWIKSLIRRM